MRPSTARRGLTRWVVAGVVAASVTALHAPHQPAAAAGAAVLEALPAGLSWAPPPLTAPTTIDVTPARLLTGLITERGQCDATAEGLRAMFRDRV